MISVAMGRGEKMDDLISRQAAIDALDRLRESTYSVDYGIVDCDDAINTIAALPPTEPKKGKWIDDGSELGCQCSQCGKTLDEYINCGTEYMTLTEIPKFCPNCGAKMEEKT